MGPAVIVTGGAGYIGAHTCKALSGAGFLPVTFDNLSLGHEHFVRWGPLVMADTRDAGAMARAIAEHTAVAVIHFASLSSIDESVRDPGRYYENNVGGLLAMLEGMGQAGCGAIIFSSSASVYGEADGAPITENAPTAPISPYGRTKLICEGILADFGAAHGLKSLALRYFNAGGADDDGEIGELRAAETHLIPRAMMALQGYIDDFQVYGADYPTPDGTAIRDYVHVSDLADAHVLALSALLGGAAGGVMNLGAGEGHSVGEVLTAIARISGRRPIAPTGARRAGDPARLTADPSLAAKLLGFKPRRSALEQIISSAWRWHQSAHPLRNAVEREAAGSGPTP